MHRRLAAVLVIVLVGLPLPVAQAQIGPNVPAPLNEPPPPPPPTKFDEAGMSTLQKVLIFGAAVLVLAVIAFVIVRDARRAAPPDAGPRGPADGRAAAGSPRSARERERQQRAKRAKAKAARRQRKRNRPH